MNNNFFQFEQDFVDNLRCIPMLVRMKLDTCGIKLKLTHWHQLTAAERQALVDWPCSSPTEVTQYSQNLQALLIEKTGTAASELPIDPAPAWYEESRLPETVQAKAAEFNVHLTLTDWQQLTFSQRFALIKLSRSNHENANFYPALQEFGLAAKSHLEFGSKPNLNLMSDNKSDASLS